MFSMSLFRALRPLVALCSVPLLVACGYGDHSHRSDYYNNGYTQPPPTSTGTIESATIDVDQTLDVKPGKGAGAFIEYQTGGTYSITTSCDVANGECYWDILVSTLDGAAVKSSAPLDLESDDSVSIGASKYAAAGTSDQVRLVAYTGSDFDGFTFQTDPGAAIEVDALLDNGAANRFMFWVGDGALRSGAPSNPIDLVPSAE